MLAERRKEHPNTGSNAPTLLVTFSEVAISHDCTCRVHVWWTLTYADVSLANARRREVLTGRWGMSGHPRPDASGRDFVTLDALCK